MSELEARIAVLTEKVLAGEAKSEKLEEWMVEIERRMVAIEKKILIVIILLSLIIAGVGGEKITFLAKLLFAKGG